MTPEQRVLRAKIAAHASWANTENRKERLAGARKGLASKFEREVDPDGRLDPAERARRAAHARQAHFLRLAAKSAEARRARSGRAA